MLNDENKKYRNLRKQQSIENGYYQTFKKCDQTRQTYAEWLGQRSPKYVVTLVGSRFIPQSVSRELLNWFCYKVNEMILKRSFVGKGGSRELEIFVCRENAETQRKNKGKQWLNADHYHLWFNDAENLINYDHFSFKDIVFHAVRFANNQYRKSLMGKESIYKPHEFLLGGNIDIQKYYKQNGYNYEWYTMKVFEDFRLSLADMIDHIGVYDGRLRLVSFGNLKFD